MDGRFVATTVPHVHLTCDHAGEAVAFYVAAFDAEESVRHMAPDGARILHTTLAVFGGHVMVCDAFPEWGLDTMGPRARGGASVTVHVNLAERGMVDAVMASAVAHGATLTMAAAEMDWGAYYGRIVDPSGHAWSFAATHT